MTKPVFDSATPLPGSADAPPITAEQMSNFLYTAVFADTSRKIAKLINADNTANYYGQLQTTYVAPEPPKPEFLPIDRPVRIEDVEPGDILKFCYSEKWAKKYGPPHEGFPALGTEITVKDVRNGKLIYPVTTRGGTRTESQHCSLDMFSFVRRPGFAKVRDGYVKSGDTVYWLAEAGPKKFVVDGVDYDQHQNNMEHAPWCYQKAEPKVIVEYGTPQPTAIYAYLGSDYGTMQDDHDGQPI